MVNNIITDNLKVLVFSSNINTPANADQIQQALLSDDHIYQVDVDLEDIDNVLRVECHLDCPSTRIQERVSQLGFNCTSLLN